MSPEQLALAAWLTTHSYTHLATWTFGKAWPRGPTKTAVDYHVRNWIEKYRIQNAFMVVEKGTSGQRRAHAHGLLGDSPLLPKGRPAHVLFEDWSKRYGRCQILPLEGAQEGVASYVSKYCCKLPSTWAVTRNGRF